MSYTRIPIDILEIRELANTNRICLLFYVLKKNKQLTDIINVSKRCAE